MFYIILFFSAVSTCSVRLCQGLGSWWWCWPSTPALSSCPPWRGDPGDPRHLTSRPGSWCLPSGTRLRTPGFCPAPPTTGDGCSIWQRGENSWAETESDFCLFKMSYVNFFVNRMNTFCIWYYSTLHGTHATRASIPSHLSCFKNFVNEMSDMWEVTEKSC